MTHSSRDNTPVAVEQPWRSDREQLEEAASAADLQLADDLRDRLNALGHHETAQRRALLLDLVINVINPYRLRLAGQDRGEGVREALENIANCAHPDEPHVYARQALAHAAVGEGLDEDGYLWRWVERGLFDKSVSAKEALSVMAHHPAAPWKTRRWDVDHKPYASAFYEAYPRAAAPRPIQAGEGK